MFYGQKRVVGKREIKRQPRLVAPWAQGNAPVLWLVNVVSLEMKSCLAFVELLVVC